MKLSNDQKVAVQLVTDWFKDKYFKNPRSMAIIKGYAGTGKSTIVQEFMNHVGLSNQNVLTLATSGIAVKNIQEKTQTQNAMTVSSFIKVPHVKFKLNTIDTNNNLVKTFTLQSDDNIKNHGRIFDEIFEVIENNDLAFQKSRLTEIKNMLKTAKAQYLSNNRDENEQASIDIESLNRTFDSIFKDSGHARPQIHQDVEFINRDDIQDNKFDVDKKTGNTIRLIVVDEVGMVTDEDLTTIINISENLKIPVLGLGDENQLPPVKSGFNWALLQDSGKHVSKADITVYTAKLTKVHRQDDDSGLNVFAQKFTKCNDGSQDKESLPHALVSLQKEIPHVKDVKYYEFNINNNQYNHNLFKYADVIITYMNKNVMHLNHLTRQYKFQTPTPPKKPQVGETILITQNEKKSENVASQESFKNGERFIIKKVYTDDEIKHFALSTRDDGTTAPLKQWVEDYEATKQHVMCVDLFNAHGIKRHIWLNTYMFSEPHVSYTHILNYGRGRMSSKLTKFDKHGINSGLLNDENLNSDHKHIVFATFGYALTVYKAQGLEFNNVVYYEAPWELYRNMNNPAARRYTAITRAKKNLLVMTGNLPN